MPGTVLLMCKARCHTCAPSDRVTGLAAPQVQIVLAKRRCGVVE